MHKREEVLIDFDLSSYLDSKEAIVEYLNQVLNEGDSSEFMRALYYVAKAKGMTEVANDTGLSRTSLYKIFADDAKPRFETVLKVLNALGIELKVAI